MTAPPAVGSGAAVPAEPELTGIVVHWRGEEDLERLVAAWPDDPRFELLVVDNGSRRELRAGRARLLRAHANLGFGGGVNLALAAARAPLVLLLNPDAWPAPGCLEALLDGFVRLPDAAGLAPQLVGNGDEPQFAWQLARLPTVGDLLRHALLLPARRSGTEEPPSGAPVEQPAAAALALRRAVLVEVAGMDERFYPAWFGDVDLALRLRAAGKVLRYWPAARVRHRLGSSIPQLGYGPFLWIYYRNLERFLAKHHGRPVALIARPLLLCGMLLRLLLLPVRRPRRAPSRGAAAAGLLATALGAATGWRLPAAWAAAWRRPDAAGRGGEGAAIR